MVENKRGMKSTWMQETSEKPVVVISVCKDDSLVWIDVFRNGTKYVGHLKFIWLTRFVTDFHYIMPFLNFCIVSIRYFYLLSTNSVLASISSCLWGTCHLVERLESHIYWIILQWCQTEDRLPPQRKVRKMRIVVSQLLLKGSMKNGSASHHDINI